MELKLLKKRAEKIPGGGNAGKGTGGSLDDEFRLLLQFKLLLETNQIKLTSFFKSAKFRIALKT